MVAATEEVAEAIMGDSVEATEEVAEAVVTVMVVVVMVMVVTATTEDMDMVGGAILTDGATPTGGVILTIHTPTLITALITMVIMGNRRCLHKELPLRQNPDNTNHLIGTSARTQRVTTRTLKIARVVG